ncbi:hypothetical protein [Rhizobium leucaenae]|uniref:Uncharacterized protein n=1 Tax=Rhizobium leucaenae TaxID=29450 RepID=A0A7W6ZY08_9HYPH|nr:hypothetical protein [Rhizobium leucaenae]MBB4570327.1 hypothetical protein [Rhizobium leucaenae]
MSILRHAMYAAAACSIFISLPAVAEDASEVKLVPNFIHIRESGGFLEKTLHEGNTEEFAAFVTAVCTVAYDCMGFDTAGLAAIAASEKITSGGDFATSGRIDKHGGEDWYIAFPPPPGYTTCSASYDHKTISLNKGDSAQGKVFRGSHGDYISTYSVVPKHRPEGHWVNVDFIVKYVKAGTEQNHNCAGDNTWVWHEGK